MGLVPTIAGLLWLYNWKILSMLQKSCCLTKDWSFQPAPTKNTHCPTQDVQDQWHYPNCHKHMRALTQGKNCSGRLPHTWQMKWGLESRPFGVKWTDHVPHPQTQSRFSRCYRGVSQRPWKNTELTWHADLHWHHARNNKGSPSPLPHPIPHRLALAVGKWQACCVPVGGEGRWELKKTAFVSTWLTWIVVDVLIFMGTFTWAYWDGNYWAECSQQYLSQN